MGNYYEGELSLKLLRTTPKKIIDKLIKIGNRYEFDNEYTNLNYENGGLEYPAIHIYTDSSYEEIDEINEEYEAKGGFDVLISYCTKYYNKKSEQFLIDIIKELVPYRYPNSSNYLGCISDEDHTYKKFFYWDFERFHEIEKRREFLCKDCNLRESYNGDELCDHFERCKRAYNIGIMNAD